MFAFLKRISLFLITNLLVVMMFSLILFWVNQFYPGLLEMYGGMSLLVLYAAIFWFGGALLSLLLSRVQAKWIYKIELIDGAVEDPRLSRIYRTVARIVQSEGIDMPEVGVYHSPDPNAFATGPSQNKALVAVSTWLLDAMTDDEVEWVVGHEMAHILNGDMVTLTLITGVLNTFVIIVTELATRAVVTALAKNSEDGEWVGFLARFLIHTLLSIVFGFLASLVIMYFSRIREYRADLGGAQFTSKSKMIAGLRKLQKITERHEHQEPKTALSAFMITEPDSFFSTHPSLSNRIQALEENYHLV